jgi:hypothetical protein
MRICKIALVVGSTAILAIISSPLWLLGVLQPSESKYAAHCRNVAPRLIAQQTHHVSLLYEGYDLAKMPLVVTGVVTSQLDGPPELKRVTCLYSDEPTNPLIKSAEVNGMGIAQAVLDSLNIDTVVNDVR